MILPKIQRREAEQHILPNLVNSWTWMQKKRKNVSAVIYSIVKIVKANGLNVCKYLHMILLYMPECKNNPADIEMLLLWSDFIKKHCTGLIDMETIIPENCEKLPI